MLVALIEFHIRPGREDRYAEVAQSLHEHVQGIDGFISVERFESRTNEGKLLSISYWRDAEALKRWRTDALHREGMVIGKNEVFQDYRITIAEVTRDYDFTAKD